VNPKNSKNERGLPKNLRWSAKLW